MKNNKRYELHCVIDSDDPIKTNEGKKAILRMAGLGTMVDRIEASLCPTCGCETKLSEMRDELSRKEFNISGMCQTCQDSVFKTEDFE